MNCKKCSQEPPKFFFRSYIGSAATEIFLCEDCTKAMSGGGKLLGFVNGDIITESTGAIAFSNKDIEKAADLECTCCGTNLMEINNTGMFGCEECYSVYSDLLMVAEAGVEQSKKDEEENVDKEYEKTVPLGKIQVLERQMERAVGVENYEMAAKLRDEINSLKEKSK